MACKQCVTRIRRRCPHFVPQLGGKSARSIAVRRIRSYLSASPFRRSSFRLIQSTARASEPSNNMLANALNTKKATENKTASTNTFTVTARLPPFQSQFPTNSSPISDHPPAIAAADGKTDQIVITAVTPRSPM